MAELIVSLSSEGIRKLMYFAIFARLKKYSDIKQARRWQNKSNNKPMKYTLVIIVLALFVSCSKEKEKDYIVENEIEIADYIAKHNLDAKKSNTGLYYVVDEAGTGKEASLNSYVNVAYKGYFTNERVFDESNSDGVFTNLQQVIKGWTEGITYFKEGGSGKLLVPAHLAYGNSTTGTIPGGSVLVFDIKLIKVYKEYKDMETDIKAKNEKEITDYIAVHDLDAKKSDTGLYYVIDEPGIGKEATANSNVTVAYKGYFTNDKVFDQSHSSGSTFNLNGVIKGWTEGIPHFKEGGSGKLLVPAHLAYGNSSHGPIPGGSVLIFDIKLISVN